VPAGFDVDFDLRGQAAWPAPQGGSVQIAKTGTLRSKAAGVAWFKRDLDLKQHGLPLALIAIAMLGYVVIVWQWL
jgi:hypothetical protein